MGVAATPPDHAGDRMQSRINFGDYAAWVAAHDTLRDADRDAIRAAIAGIAEPPLFTILCLPDPLGAPTNAALPAAILGQLYPHWEVLLPTGMALAEAVEDERIRRIKHDGQDLADLIRAAAAEARGAFVLPITTDAILAEQALFELAMAIDNPGAADMLYSDEDRLTADGARTAPRFKTGWDGESALSHDLPGMLVAYRTSLLAGIQGLRKGRSGAAAFLFDLSLRAAARTSPLRIRHIPAILCHRATDAAPDGSALRDVARDFLADMKIDAQVMPAPLFPAYSRIAYRLPAPAPLVSIIIPTRDHADLLRRCVDGILSRTDYPDIEVLIVDNGSVEADAVELLRDLAKDPRVIVLPCPIPFNYAKLNNIAARQARGEILVLLNNDIDVLAPSWLRELVSHAVRPDVGAVGARLLYADGRVQHAGIVLGPALSVTHQLRFADRLDPGPYVELAVTRTVSAVTGACLAIRRAVFFELGGLNEAMRVTYNDVDLCLRVGDHGYRVIWTAFAELLHLECATRGLDSETPGKQAFALGEAYFFVRYWHQTLARDPFHNPNIVYGVDTTHLAAPPRRARPWEAHAPGTVPTPQSWIMPAAPADPVHQAAWATSRLLAKVDQMRAELYQEAWRAEQAELRMAQEWRRAEENLVAAEAARHRLQNSEAELARLLDASTVRIALAAGRVVGLIPAPLRGLLRRVLRRVLRRR